MVEEDKFFRSALHHNVHREIRIGHLLFNGALQAAAARRGVEEEIVIRIGIKRSEEWNALDVIPVKVGEEDVRVDGPILVLLQELLAQIAEAGATVKD